ncbi:MAG TPA: hypothetical protein VNJ08_15560 [Bacteriovoracaceae bacterium]|nr:hypothetical protein [Bacteriovoracaceae bacterium]
MGLFIVTTISLYSTTYLFFWKLHKKALAVGIEDDHVFHQFLANQKYDMDLLFIGLMIFNFLLLLGVGFVISHRIAGPVQKLKNHLADPAQPDQFKLRENDFFKELVPIVNEIKQKLKP